MSQALRVDLDDLTVARLARVARARGDTLQELANLILRDWTPQHGALLPIAVPLRGPRVLDCQQCGQRRRSRRGARGLCGPCYQRAWREQHPGADPRRRHDGKAG